MKQRKKVIELRTQMAIRMIGQKLAKLVKKIRQKKSCNQGIYNVKLRIPMIRMYDYLNQFARYLDISKECFVIGLLFVDRLLKTKRELKLNSYQHIGKIYSYDFIFE